MRYFSGDDDTDISIIPPNGQTLFIGGGSWQGVGSGASRSITVTNDGNIRETILIVTTFSNSGIFQFGIDSLVGNNTKEYKVSGSGNILSFNLWGWVENTSRIRDVTI